MKLNMTHSRDISVPKRNTGASQLSIRAFTLVELLVVIAITSILLALLFGPIISSFNLTRRARSISQAQDAARFGLERLTRELGRATYVYDNGLTPVAIPMGMAFDRDGNGMIRKLPTATFSDRVNFGDASDLNNPSKWPTLAYARIDLVQSAVRQNNTDIIDPTTGQPVGGAELRPGVRGKRVTRYFLGLRNPGKNPQTGNQLLYQNRYEFRRFDENGNDVNNPVILYRAEYDPTDPNLFDMTWDNTSRSRPTYNSTVANSGGFNDPAFFYADKIANSTLTDNNGNAILDPRGQPVSGNGRSYAENWQAIAQPVLVSENVDLLRWNRVSPTSPQTGQSTIAYTRDYKDAKDPVSPTTTFAPVAVPDDVAAPGFLTSGGVETPAAVPTLYQTKYAAWTYPYTITVLRGSTGYNNGTPRPGEPFGALTLTVDRQPNGNIFVVNTTARPIESTGTLSMASANLYTVYSPTTRKLLIKTPRLTFSVDADRGRIETAFPPLMGTQNGSGEGVPYYIAAGTITAQAVPASPASPGAGDIPVSQGELIPTFFSLDTRDPQSNTAPNPVNLGIFQANLFTSSYFPTQTGLGGTLSNASPLLGFGERATGVETRGVRIIPGSERITAPTSDGGAPTSWSRIGASGSVLQPQSKFDPVAPIPPAGPGTEPRFTIVPERQAVYSFKYDEYPDAANVLYDQIFAFDLPGTPGAYSTAGSYPSGMAAARTAGINFLTATYLWQNNFSRNPCVNTTAPCTPDLQNKWGNPLTATGALIDFGGAARPEADIFRIDYATRQQYNINLGARIYDPSDGRAQTIQVTDKVIINNVLR